jgi:D-glycero-D-manno-heptose 1,7-bisphosphate phosphatase
MKSSRTGEPMVPVLYCDIDGTIRWGKDELGRFVNGPEDVYVFDGVPELLWRYKRAGWRIIGVSNQGGIALGHQTMVNCMRAMAETQRQTRFAFDKLSWCPHHPDAKDPEMAVCWCRKPKAGLVIEAALSLSEQTGELYPPHLGLFIGDRFEDTECARAASLDFMAAARWREGEHITQIEAKATEAIEDWERKAEKIRQDFVAGLISAHDARKALGIDPEIRVRVEPLDQASLDAALKITGVETRTVAVRELEPAEEFFYQGFLYEVTAKTELMLQARKTDDPMQTITFFDSSFIEQRQMSEGSIPWSTEVIANDKSPFKDFNG